MFVKIILSVTAATLILSSCVTRLSTPAGIPEISVSDYEDIVLAKSKKKQVYDGFQNQISVQATWLDSSVTDANLSHSARLYQWTLEKYKEEKNKAISRHTTSTEFFVSFFTPERKNNDLSSKKTDWKIFLDINGQRYEGKAVRMKNILPEVQVMYPYHNRWSTAYMVSFPIATAVVENKPAIMTFTGSISTLQIEF